MDATDGQQTFLGRQSILDRDRNLRAFELLFRSDLENRAEVGNASAATATVISFALNEFGLKHVLGVYRGFINVDAEMLMSESIELLPSDKVVLEILETVAVTPAIVERCRELRKRGFVLAMDDFVRYDDVLLPLLEVVDIVKVDVQKVDCRALAETVRRLRRFNVKLLAEKVDSTQQLHRCMELGFDLFQGYFFAKPEIITGRRLSSSETVLLQVLGMVMQDAETADIEKALKRDPGLSFNMLRLVNSVATGIGKKVNSLASALIVLGRRQLQRWLQLLLFAHLSPGTEFPSALLQLAAARGKFLELLAAGNAAEEDRAFMAGIVSLMDTLLGMPLAEILVLLPVDDEVRGALLERRGHLGRMLLLAESLERCDPAVLRAAMAALPEYTTAQVTSAQAEALAWANSIAEPAG